MSTGRRVPRAALLLAGAVTLAAGLPPALAGSLSGSLRAAAAELAYYRSQLPPGAAVDCTGPASYPAPGTAAWRLRDLENQVCATERLQDESTNPASGLAFSTQTPGLYAAQNLSMLGQPGHLHISLGQLVPGGSTADPFRTLARWTAAGRGRVLPVSFPATDGATLNGYVFEPPAQGRDPVTGLSWNGTSRLPGVVITTGSIQGYQQLYFWAAEGLAEAGYIVMTYDVQGQGSSDTFPGGGPAGCAEDMVGSRASCPGVPFQQSYNFFQGAEDALNFFFSDRNPASARLDSSEIGIAGHSLGATAVSNLAQCDPRVRAVVAWDYLAAATGACRADFAGLPAGAPTQPTVRVPALTLNSDYFLNPEPMTAPPDPRSDAKSAGFEQVAGAAVDAMQVSLRESTHLEYTYVPYILPASRLGERVAFYYTLAWFDRYLRGATNGDVAGNAYERLVATRFGDSADVHSIGSGTFSAATGNVPYLIKGLAAADRLSIYYPSMYRLTDPRRDRVVSCNSGAGDLGHECWGGPQVG